MVQASQDLPFAEIFSLSSQVAHTLPVVVHAAPLAAMPPAQMHAHRRWRRVIITLKAASEAKAEADGDDAKHCHRADNLHRRACLALHVALNERKHFRVFHCDIAKGERRHARIRLVRWVSNSPKC